jgi:hypothetical protein
MKKTNVTVPTAMEMLEVLSWAGVEERMKVSGYKPTVDERKILEAIVYWKEVRLAGG